MIYGISGLILMLFYMIRALVRAGRDRERRGALLREALFCGVIAVVIGGVLVGVFYHNA